MTRHLSKLAGALLLVGSTALPSHARTVAVKVWGSNLMINDKLVTCELLAIATVRPNGRRVETGRYAYRCPKRGGGWVYRKVRVSLSPRRAVAGGPCQVGTIRFLKRNRWVASAWFARCNNGDGSITYSATE